MRLQWDVTGNKLYETGTKQVVLYPQSNGVYPKGVAWSGVSGFTVSPSGAEATAIYADDSKYLNLISAEEVGGTIECYMYPDEFDECNGRRSIAKGVSVGQQTRTPFGLCVKTTLGNDVDSNDYGYVLHMLYGCTAGVSEKAYQSINDSPEAMTMSYELTTTPVTVPGFKPTAYITVDSTKTPADKLKALEDILYGTDANEDGDVAATDARLPLPEEIISIIGVDVG